jgi:hypothetical protein
METTGMTNNGSYNKQAETSRVRRYLRALEAQAGSPLRGLKTRTWVERQITALPERIQAETDPLKRLLLVQELMDRQSELADMPTPEEFARIEEDFVAVAKAFSERKGVSYAAWRHVRVEAEVLERAGITRS